MNLLQKATLLWQSTPDFLQALLLWIVFVAAWIALGLWAAGYSDKNY